MSAPNNKNLLKKTNNLSKKALLEHLQNNETYRDEEKKIRRWGWAAKFFAIMTGAAIGAVGAVAVQAVFPFSPLWLAAAVFVGGLVIEAIKYWRDNHRSFKIFAVVGIIRDIKNRIYKRELLRREQCEFIKKVLQDNHEIPLTNRDDLLAQFKKDGKKNKNVFSEKYGCSVKEFNERWLAHRKLTKEYIELCFAARKHVNAEHDTLKPWVKHFEKQLENIRNERKDPEKKSLWARWNRFYYNVDAEIKIKSVLGVFAGIWAIGNGIGFGSLMFMHLQILFAGVIASTLLPALIACDIGVCVGIGYWMLMYMLLNKAIVKNIFWRKILNPLTKLFYIKGGSDMEWSAWFKACLNNIISMVLIAALITIAVLVNFASSGTWLKSTVAFFQWIGSLSSVLSFFAGCAPLLAGITVLVFMTPVAIIFSFENGFETAKRVAGNVKDFWHNIWARPSAAQQGQPWSLKVVAKYALLFVVAFVLLAAFAFHVFGEGGVAGEGVNDKGDIFVGIFDKVTQFIDKLFYISLTPATLAVVGNTLVESGEDGVFTVREFERFKGKLFSSSEEDTAATSASTSDDKSKKTTTTDPVTNGMSQKSAAYQNIFEPFYVGVELTTDENNLREPNLFGSTPQM